MPEITRYVSKLTLLDGTVVGIKDAVARQAIAGGLRFLGITTTALVDLETISTITVNGSSVTATNGDMVIYGNKEFIFSGTDSKWHELGDLTNLGSLASKNSATGVYTPEGFVSKPLVDITPTEATISEFDDSGSVTAGVAASCTLPTLTTTYDSIEENLTLSWSGGSFTTNTPTVVTLPTSKNATVLTAVYAELHNAPVFTGTQATITVT